MRIHNWVIDPNKFNCGIRMTDFEIEPSYDENYDGHEYVCGYEITAVAHMDGESYGMLFHVPLSWDVKYVVASEWWSDPSLTDAMRELFEAEFKARYFKKIPKPTTK